MIMWDWLRVKMFMYLWVAHGWLILIIKYDKIRLSKNMCCVITTNKPKRKTINIFLIFFDSLFSKKPTLSL